MKVLAKVDYISFALFFPVSLFGLGIHMIYTDFFEWLETGDVAYVFNHVVFAFWIFFTGILMRIMAKKIQYEVQVRSSESCIIEKNTWNRLDEFAHLILLPIICYTFGLYLLFSVAYDFFKAEFKLWIHLRLYMGILCIWTGRLTRRRSKKMFMEEYAEQKP